MNKHLLKTRLNSIHHYTDEIKRLEEAKKQTEATRADLLKSLNEFFPWKAGMIIMKGEQVRRFKQLTQIMLHYNDNRKIKLTMFLEYPKDSGFEGDRDSNHHCVDMTWDELDDWKIIYEPETVAQ